MKQFWRGPCCQVHFACPLGSCFLNFFFSRTCYSDCAVGLGCSLLLCSHGLLVGIRITGWVTEGVSYLFEYLVPQGMLGSAVLPATCEGVSGSVVSDSFATPWKVACQAPLSMGFFRQEYWSGMPFPPPVQLPWKELSPVGLFNSLDLGLLALVYESILSVFLGK